MQNPKQDRREAVLYRERPRPLTVGLVPLKPIGFAECDEAIYLLVKVRNNAPGNFVSLNFMEVDP